jgi:hypothetical protein
MSRSIDKPVGTITSTKEMLMFNPTTGQMERFTFAALTTYMGGGGVDVTSPTVVSRRVENATPNRIDLLYNEALNSGSAPATSAFTVSGGKTVTGVAIVGSTVRVTVNTPYSAGDTITIGYTVPGSNQIKDVAGNQAAAFTAAAVTNAIVAGGGFVDITSWTSLTDTTVTGNDLVAGTIGTAKAVSTNYLPANTEGKVRYTLTMVGSKGGILALSEGTAAEDYTQIKYGIYVDASIIGTNSPEFPTGASGITAVNGYILEIERRIIGANYTMIFRYSTDSGATFTTIRSSTTYNSAALYVKFVSPFNTAVRCDDIQGLNVV